MARQEPTRIDASGCYQVTVLGLKLRRIPGAMARDQGERRALGRLCSTLLTVLVVGSLGTVSPVRAQSDDWLGRDKALHFGLSVGLAAGAYAMSAPFVEEPVTRFALGVGTGFSVGILKEIWDATGRGTPSGRDLAWDAAGVATGAAISLLVDRLRRRRTRAVRLSFDRGLRILY